MRGLWLEDKRLGYREDLPHPELRTGEALIQMELAGICRTDIELVRGYYPFRGIPGHEFIGEILRSPDQVEELRIDLCDLQRRRSPEFRVSGVCGYRNRSMMATRIGVMFRYWKVRLSVSSRTVRQASAEPR